MCAVVRGFAQQPPGRHRIACAHLAPRTGPFPWLPIRRSFVRVASRMLRDLAVAVAVVIPAAVAAQQRAVVSPAAMAGPVDTALLAGVRWRSIGPASNGRSVAVAGSVTRPNEYYIGTTGGGVWKTTDGGRAFTPVTDAYFGGT